MATSSLSPPQSTTSRRSPIQHSAHVRQNAADRAWDTDELHVNVAASERLMSIAASAALVGLGLARRDLRGLLMVGIGGALAYRGATGHCHLYDAVDINTANFDDMDDLDEHGVHVSECFLIDKPADELYRQWRDFERLPRFMTHLKSVQMLDEKRSLWTSKAPAISGGQMQWEAEITVDRPHEHIEWETLPGSEIQHHGSVSFRPALGDRGTNVRVELQYAPPLGQFGRWVAKLFGEEPEQQIRSDLRKFKQLMETGEIPTTAGQPRGKCHGAGRLFGN